MGATALSTATSLPSPSPIVLAVTALAAVASRVVASADDATFSSSTVPSSSISPSASSTPSQIGGAVNDGGLAVLLVVPLVFVIWLWMIVSKPAVILHSSQAFFNFLAMCCFASVASFQAKWGVGPSGLTGFAIFISIAGLLLALFMMLVPVIDVKYSKLTRLARALSEVRVGFILSGAGTGFSLLIAFISTISAWTEPGCKDPNNDPHHSLGAAFRSGLSGWCTTKKAGAIFFWLTFAFWLGTFIVNIMNWRGGKGPRDPPFQPPMGAGADGDYDELEDDEESTYGRVPPLRDNSNNANSPFSDNAAANRQSQASSYVLPPVSGVGGFGASGAGAIPASRPSMDAYGAFSDPTPSGYGDAPPTVPSTFGAASGLSGSSGGGVSRTMQYADPYAAVRASIAGATNTPPASSWAAGSPVRSPQGPPSYTEYTGYR